MDKSLYRQEKEEEKGRKEDPITFAKNKLINNKLLTIQQIYQLDLVISNEMDKAMNFAIKSPLNSNREIFKDVFDNDKPLPTSIKARINKILNS